MQENPLYIKDVGFYKVSSADVIDGGSDGGLWLPDKSLAVVADGISSEAGDGQADVDCYQESLENVESKLNNFKK